jgi:hypothetical protein
MMKRVLKLFLLAFVLVLPTATTDGAARPDWRQALRDPSPEFSQMPFWFWNDTLNDDEIKRQMADFRAHGVYGFVIHARMGLPRETPYMKDAWLGHVRAAVEEAVRTGMRVCLYDEGMYPSGSAHGEVVRANPAFAARGLAMTSQDVSGPGEVARPASAEGESVATVVARRAKGKDTLDPDSLRLIDPADSAIRLPEGDWRVMRFTCVPSHGHIRGVHEGEDDGQPGAPAAADLLNPEAMKAFIRFAYEPYYRVLKDHFGKTVIGMFTDEPNPLGRGARRGLQPWTAGFERYFEQRRGYSLLLWLPALFHDVGPRTPAIRQDYRLTLAGRLNETYYRPLSTWCEEHGIALTGHPAGAAEIEPLRYFQIPGQDLVWRGVVPGAPSALEGENSSLPKCSSSVARHDRRRRNSNEVYGAYGWQLTMEEMKWVADWLMVRGVNVLYPHAFYYSVRGNRGNERPPDVGPHNAWWPHYRLFADYTARLCGLLADGRQVCDVAILGANNRLPWRAAQWLYQHQVDFNYLEEWRLCEQAKLENGRTIVGDAAYRCLIVDQDGPPSDRLAERLRAVEAAGVRVRYCRGTPGPELIEGLGRDIVADPAADDLRSVHLVRDGLDFYYLVNEGEQEIATTLLVHTSGRAEWFDAWSAQSTPAVITWVDGGSMRLPLRLPRRGSLVLCVDRGSSATVSAEPSPGKTTGVIAIHGPWTVLDASGKEVGGSLGDWRDLSLPAAFAGKLRYRTRFVAARRDGTEYRLDLGRVAEFAVVHLNGCGLGVKFWSPFTWDVTQAIHDGENELIVEVTNSLASRFEPRTPRPSGLFGPVRIEARSARRAMPGA